MKVGKSRLLKDSESCLDTADIVRKHGISEQTQRWKSKVGGPGTPKPIG